VWFAVKKIVVERRRKLASYEVAGWNEQIDSVPEGTVESGGRFPSSLAGRIFAGGFSSHFVAG